MNIGFLIDSISRRAGGLFDANRFLAQHLQQLGNNVVVVGVRDGFTDDDREEWGTVKLRISDAIGPRRLGFAPSLRRVLSEVPIDVLHTHGLWTFSSWVSLNWHRRTRRPIVIHPHGMLDSWALESGAIRKRVASWAFEQRHLKSASVLRALCEAELKSFRQLGLRNPVAVIPNGIAIPAAQKSPIRGNTSSGRSVLLFLGRLHPKKGLENLLRAWAALKGAGVEDGTTSIGSWVIAVAGWDELGHEHFLKQLATSLDLNWIDRREDHLPNKIASADLWFLGPKFGAEKATSIEACHAFVLPSFSEGLPMAALEAWAYSKPVLLSPQCNLPEGVAHQAAIEIAPSVPGIKQGLLTLFGMSVAERESMGRRGRRLVESQFSWTEVASKFRDVSDWLVNGTAKPSCVVND